MALTSIPPEADGEVEVFEWTKAEYRRALKAALGRIPAGMGAHPAQGRHPQPSRGREGDPD